MQFLFIVSVDVLPGECVEELSALLSEQSGVLLSEIREWQCKEHV